MASSRGRANSDRWERGFAALTRFRAREGHCCPPQTHVEGKFRLGQWVSVQRYLKDKLSGERTRRLDRMGFVWNFSEYRWNNGFKSLLKFGKRKGHCRVPAVHCEKNTNLDCGFPRNVEERTNCQSNRGRS